MPVGEACPRIESAWPCLAAVGAQWALMLTGFIAARARILSERKQRLPAKRTVDAGPPPRPNLS